MASIGLGTGQPRLLSYLEENGPSSPRDLAEYYELDPAGVSRMLDALSKKGLVAIAPAADDRRSKVVSLTAEGKRVSQSWSAACREEASAMLEGFTPEERAEFADYLVRAHANLRAYGRQLAGEEPLSATERIDPMPAGEEPRPASALSQPSAPEEAPHA
nr:MarR family transcriptional regulator [Enorma massiliensis]